ncbi:hypothetical protein DNFV4_01308 [Nitrospira tepida]|uniref:RDD domain-containing protein n=1 Tax=Nitrospira tepida TaxID=2973512 RepID=A0AA86T378_9BACT|nr:RDD family protein [Nitrospira tepida]CAI4030876.1 hypothetical protein DNFV4_01308 [Nitrospira tepida]
MQGDGVLQEERARSHLLTEVYPKAHVVNRGLARSADLLIAATIDQAVPPIGFFAGLAYLLAADGLSGGRSLGKRLVGLRTWSLRRREAASFGESIVRNLPVALVFLLYQVPYIGWLLSLAVLIVEGLLVLGNDRGLRFGDILAQTQVVDADQLDMPDSR